LNNDTSIENIKTYLKNNNFKVLIKLASPIVHNLPPHSTELKTFLSQNNVWSNADYVEVEYDLHETQNILARKQFIIANQPHIVKPAAAPLQNFVTDMAAPLKECKVHFSPVQDTSNGAPSPDNICPISGWNNVITSINRAPLPVEYQEVEYIQSTSIYSYFITDYYPNDKTDYYIKIHQGNSITDEFYPTAFSAGSQFELYKNAYYVWVNCKGTSRFSTAGYGTNRQLIEMFTNGNSWTIVSPGVRTSTYSIPSYSSFISEKPLIILAREVNGEIRDNHIADPWPKLYRFTLYENSKTVRDYIPCYRRSDNEVGLYDLVNKTFLTHSGEGTFDAGPDITTGSIIYTNWANEAGTIYGGYVDLVTGEVWETWGLKDLGTVNWSKYSNRAGVFYSAVMAEFPATSKLGVLCNKYASTHDNVTEQPDKSIGDAYQLRARSFAIYDTDYADATVAEFKTVMSGVIAAYPLATPTLVTTLTPTALRTLIGTNNIWASNGGDNIEIAYWKH